jgi:hypothetical protein
MGNPARAAEGKHPFMSTYQNQVVISDLDHWLKTIPAMEQAGQLEKFNATFSRLMTLIARYLAEDTPPDRRRTASLWADKHREHDWYWYIREEPASVRSPDQSTKRLMVGGLNYHPAYEQCWSINT